MDDLISRQDAIRWVKAECNPYGQPTLDYESGIKVIEHLEHMSSVQSEKRTEERTETHACDLIDRQAAIDAVDSKTVSTNPDHFKSSEKFIKFMDDADIASFGKWQWANGFNTALTAVGIDLKKLPSAQPEIIRCKDCKYNSNPPECGNACCDTFYGMTDQMGFCHMAERREDD